ncbi:hypothetical protein EV363DRAFT_1357385 [Boletus edulis]|uniref:Uncharacterized protein n=1 Tax=Boletus edulis BED1 TaxID=1328754 RepID=A0AAD4BC09_BOLED|nr:hypothetical protein EV363DRAFT_1357385 [Boletus edulis]KAF8417174.1 hypothetical protein L210DRAFT_3581270 [Boletus edulis BED1]
MTLPQAIEDNLIPLSKPVRSKSGELIDSLTIAKGSLVAIPMECMCLGKNFVVTEFKVCGRGDVGWLLTSDDFLSW